LYALAENAVSVARDTGGCIESSASTFRIAIDSIVVARMVPEIRRVMPGMPLIINLQVYEIQISNPT